ncbi:ATP synthase F1 subunit delta [Myxococcota bacterium]|nr:ATP synthase F1 subunit delta [Myxococcota bacterium]
MSALAKRYARGLVAATQEGDAKIVESLSSELRTFLAAWDSSDALRELLLNPSLRVERASVLDKVLEKLSLSKYVDQTIRLLAERDRMKELRSVADEVEGIVDGHAGRLRAFVISAMDLTDAQQKRLKDALKKRFNKEIALVIETDQNIVGGLIVRVGDTTMDSSIKRQLELMQERLESHSHH